MSGVPDAWRVGGGRVEALTLPAYPDRYVIPGIRAAALDVPDAPVCVLPGAHHPHWRDHALLLVADVAVRVTPWATWYCAPGFLGSAVWGGCAWGVAEVALIRSDADPPSALRTALHEAWHLCEEHVRPDLLADLDARLALGPAWPGDYLGTPCERRARAFASFGGYLVEGGRVTVGGSGTPFESDLFWYVFSGGLAAEVQALRAPRKPGLLRRAAALLAG